MDLGSIEVIKRYVELGLGISIVTGICLTGRESLVAVPFHRYFPRRTYGIVLRKGKILPPPAARFIALIEEHVPRGRGRRNAPMLVP
jgi:DNA-binding transcriptional LysR family regulator